MASPIKITVVEDQVSQKPRMKIISFEGQLDESNIDDQAATIYSIIDAMPEDTYLIFDLSGLMYMNSKSIGYLTDWHLKVTEKHGEILLAKARENILDILNVVGLTQIIKSYLTVDEAKLAAVQLDETRG